MLVCTRVVFRAKFCPRNTHHSHKQKRAKNPSIESHFNQIGLGRCFYVALSNLFFYCLYDNNNKTINHKKNNETNFTFLFRFKWCKKSRNGKIPKLSRDELYAPVLELKPVAETVWVQEGGGGALWIIKKRTFLCLARILDSLFLHESFCKINCTVQYFTSPHFIQQ